MENTKRQLRSWMFVPGHRQRMIDKSFGLDALDAVLLDIEDGVAPAEKDSSRRQIGASLDRLQKLIAGSQTSVCTPARYVRVNAVGYERMRSDLAEVIRPTLEGLALPKIESPAQVRMVAEILDRRETQMGLPIDSINLLLAIESPKGLMNAYELATSSARVIGLMFGAEDFGKELGLPFRREGEAADMLYARSALVTAAAAANVQAVDGVWPNLQDTEGLKAFALQSRRLGFTGMSLIHPSQVDPVNAAFTPLRMSWNIAGRSLRLTKRQWRVETEPLRSAASCWTVPSWNVPSGRWRSARTTGPQHSKGSEEGPSIPSSPAHGPGCKPR